MRQRVGAAEITDQEPDVAEDEQAAARCDATSLLITGAIAADVEIVARRIHRAGPRAPFPFVHASAAALPTDAGLFAEACASLLDAASGGSLLLTSVEEMPAVVQESLIETLAELQGARDPLPAVRLMAGTTALLHDCIATGRFSERLFYRLNTIHIVIPGGSAARAAPNAATPTGAELRRALAAGDYIREALPE